MTHEQAIHGSTLWLLHFYNRFKATESLTQIFAKWNRFHQQTFSQEEVREIVNVLCHVFDTGKSSEQMYDLFNGIVKPDDEYYYDNEPAGTNLKATT